MAVKTFYGLLIVIIMLTHTGTDAQGHTRTPTHAPMLPQHGPTSSSDETTSFCTPERKSYGTYTKMLINSIGLWSSKQTKILEERYNTYPLMAE